MRSTVLALSSRYRDSIYFTLLTQQVPAAVLCLLMLDLGQSGRICGIAMIGFWSGSALMMARRPHDPAPGDLYFLRWGFLPVMLAAGLLASLI